MVSKKKYFVGITQMQGTKDSYPRWKFHNANPFRGKFKEYMLRRPKVSHASTCFYNFSKEFLDVKPGYVRIDDLILSIQYDAQIIGDFFEIMIRDFRSESPHYHKIREIFDHGIDEPLRYLNKWEVGEVLFKLLDIYGLQESTQVNKDGLQRPGDESDSEDEPEMDLMEMIGDMKKYSDILGMDLFN